MNLAAGAPVSLFDCTNIGRTNDDEDVDDKLSYWASYMAVVVC